ncbi:hypothetical protein SESBI_01800 [Sesbania bispinosa]|nr:hypothetical protein SESBI_01800 [Sesbania bispinosa]
MCSKDDKWRGGSFLLTIHARTYCKGRNRNFTHTKWRRLTVANLGHKASYKDCRNKEGYLFAIAVSSGGRSRGHAKPPPSLRGPSGASPPRRRRYAAGHRPLAATAAACASPLLRSPSPLVLRCSTVAQPPLRAITASSPLVHCTTPLRGRRVRPSSRRVSFPAGSGVAAPPHLHGRTIMRLLLSLP